MKARYLILLFTLLTTQLYCQNYPWEQPLKIAWSNDGIVFNAPTIFQDSSGVPSVIRWKGDTLVAVFQWFRAPNPSPSWDRVAVKFSYDNGITWTQPTPIVVNGLPVNYQRPFDPTLVVLNRDSIRIYFSSSDGFPVGGLDSTVNTYSALSVDGINYTFEPNARVDEPTNRVIDPAVQFFNNACHYISPIGSPQQGAYHYISSDGINFMKVQDIPSDNTHNWTGNYMVNDSSDLRFYGAGSNGIWFNSSPNGGMWNGYVNTNIQGGDPSALRIAANNYLMIYVGPPYSTGINVEAIEQESIFVYPNPARDKINIKAAGNLRGSVYTIYDSTGRSVLTGKISTENYVIDIENLSDGNYFIKSGQYSSESFTVIRN